MKMFDAGMFDDDMLSRFHLIPERHGRTDRRTDGHNCYISISRQCADARVSVLTRDKNCINGETYWYFDNVLLVRLRYGSASCRSNTLRLPKVRCYGRLPICIYRTLWILTT